MRIRRASESESAELSALAIAAKQHWGYAADQIDVWRSALTITGGFLSTNPAFVAELEGRAVGFYALVASANAWELDHLWVLPEFTNQGFGRALLAHAQRTAGGGGPTLITIDADPHAESFYLRNGAKRVAVVAAPIPGYPDRVRPQLILAVAQSAIAVTADAR